MKFTAIALGAAALAPMVSANDIEARQAGNLICNTVAAAKNRRTTSTVYALGTTTTTIGPKTTVTSTVRTPVVSTVLKTQTKHQKTVTQTNTSTTQVAVTAKVTQTNTITAQARTISPAPKTSTVAAPSGFVPAASALANANSKRDAQKANKKAVICTTTVQDDKTVTVKKPLQTISVTVTLPGRQTSYTTQTKTITKPGADTTTIAITQTKTRTVTSLTTTKTTVTPTITLAASTVKYYAACANLNLLDYTLSTSTNATASTGSGASNSTSTSDGGDDDEDYSETTRRMRRSARLNAAHDAIKRAVFPKMKAASGTKVGINSVTGGSGLTVKNLDTVQSAYDCCAACQTTANCAGSAYYDAVGCSLYVATSCASGQSATAGSFTYDSSDVLGVGEGEIVSNGKCGAWSFGGEGSEDSGSDAGSDDE